MISQAYLENNQLDTAITLIRYLSQSQNTIWVRNNGIWDVKLHYYLAQAYEKSNWTDQAIKEYETFIKHWENADCEIDAVSDAQKRLSKLMNTP